MSNIQQRSGLSDSLLDLLELQHNRTAQSISGATLGIVKQISSAFDNSAEIPFGTAEVQPIPRWDSNGQNFIEGYFFSNDSTDKIEEGDLVLVIFTDSDFRDNIRAGLKSAQKTYNLNTHSKNFGVILTL